MLTRYKRTSSPRQRSAPYDCPYQETQTATETIAVRYSLRCFLQDRLSFEVVAFLQAGLLAFNPVGGFLNHRLQFFGVPHEEAAGIRMVSGMPRVIHSLMPKGVEHPNGTSITPRLHAGDTTV